MLIRKTLPSWNHLPGHENPGDIATRNIASNTLQSSMWFKGPESLMKNENSWPNYDPDPDVLAAEEVVKELRKSKGITTNLAACYTIEDVSCELRDVVTNATANNSTTAIVPASFNLSNVVDVTKFSSIRRLLLVTAFVLRFKNNLINKWKRKEHLIVTGDINLEEINHAEELWVKREQFTIEKGVKYEKLKKSLSLFTDDSGLLRLKGRFGNSDLSFEEKHPLLLRSDSYFTELLISNAHSTVKHSGMEATLNQLRLRFWVTKGRKTVKNVISNCVICKRFQGRTAVPPPTPNLPSYRVVADFCFQSRGIDFAGPLFVR